MKTCKNCHIDANDSTVIWDNYGAEDPTDKHKALGLLAQIVQKDRDGNVNGDHLDIISCSACHTRKLGHGPTQDQIDADGLVDADGISRSTHHSLYEWGTGGAMVDSTGPDAEGRLTDHENINTERLMENNLARIDSRNCQVCGVCYLVCPTGAITGPRSQPHNLDESKCIKCGACYEVCKFDAIAGDAIYIE